MLLTYCKAFYFNWREERAVRRLFYPQFQAMDLAIKSHFQHLNPYRICRAYRQAKGEREIHAYGETPLTLMDRIVKRFYIGAKDCVVEMGAGRGRIACFLANYHKAQVKAIEEHPIFCQILRKLDVEGLEVIEGDMLEQDLSGATVIYLYGTMLEETQIQKLIKQLPPKVKIITVSYPLKEFSSEFETLDEMEGEFPWGKTGIYLNSRIG